MRSNRRRRSFVPALDVLNSRIAPTTYFPPVDPDYPDSSEYGDVTWEPSEVDTVYDPSGTDDMMDMGD